MEPTCIHLPLVKFSADTWSYGKLVAMPESEYLINGGSLVLPGPLPSFLPSIPYLHSEKLPVVGSPFWMAPEVLRDEPYNEKVGTWYKRTLVVRCCASIAV